MTTKIKVRSHIEEVVDDIELLVSWFQTSDRAAKKANPVYQEAANKVEAWLASQQPEHDEITGLNH